MSSHPRKRAKTNRRKDPRRHHLRTTRLATGRHHSSENDSTHANIGRPCRIQVIAYNSDDVKEFTIRTVDELDDELGSGYAVLWLNVVGLGDHHCMEQIAKRFNLHPLALEDVVHLGQRPKVDEYENFLFAVIRMPHENPDRLVTEQVSIFLGEGFVITFQEYEGDCLEEVRKRIRTGGIRLRDGGPDYLTYAIIDAVIDHHFPALEEYGDRLEQIEDNVLAKSSENQLNEIHTIKRDLITLRRVIWPLRDALNTTIRDSHKLIKPETTVYLRDCYDHAVQLMDLVESGRELCSDLISLYLTQVNNRMNEVMKVLTIIATIFIPLTFIVGLYGMNFDRKSPWNMPELGWHYGYPLSLAIMVITAVGLVWFMARKGWIERSGM